MFRHAVIFACLTLLVLPTISAVAKPTRSECIVGYNLDWSEVKNPADARNSMSHGQLEVHKTELLQQWYLALTGRACISNTSATVK